MRQRPKKLTLKLKKETVAKVLLRPLSVHDLGQVIGGCTGTPRYSQDCG